MLTLTYNTNTVSFNDTDKLQIFYEVASGDPYQDRPLKVDGSGVTQPVSLSGGATAANQTSELTKLDTLHIDLGTIDGHVDGLETAVASTNTKLDTLHADVDGLETAVASTNTKLDTVHSDLLTIDGHVDGLETLGTSTNTKLDTLHADVDGLETAVASTNTKLDTLHSDVDGLETAVASTNTKLDTVHADLASIDAGVPSALGQGVMSASMSVVVASDQTAVSTVASGSVAHDTVDSGNPIKTGGQARTTNPTAVDDGDRTNFIADKLGKQVVVGAIRDLKANQQTTITSSTAETTIVTAVASVFLDLYGLIITNTSSLGTKVTIKDATAGTTRFVFWVPANDTRGFMLNESAAVKQAATNNNWTATAGTAVSSLEITALTVQNV